MAGALELALPEAQRLGASPGVAWLVGEIVGGSAERVERPDVLAQVLRHEALGDGVVLEVARGDPLTVGERLGEAVRAWVDPLLRAQANRLRRGQRKGALLGLDDSS